MDYQSFRAAIQQDSEEERKRRQQAIRERARNAKEGREAKRESEKNPVDHLRDLLGGIGNFVKETATDVKDEAVEAAGTVGDIVKETADIVTGADERKRQEFETRAKVIQNDYNTGKINLDELNRRSAALQSEWGKATSVKDESLQKRDATKSAAATADTFLNVATLGVGSISKALLKKGGIKFAEELGSQAAKSGGRKFAEGVAEGAGIGGAQGAIAPLVEDGDNAQASDIATNAALGVGLGGVLGGGLSFIDKDVRKAAGETAGKLKSEVVKRADVPSAAAEKASGLPRVNVLNDNEAYTLGDFSEYLMGNQNKLKNSEINELSMQARNAAKTAGIDITSGSRADVQARIADYLERRDLFKETQGTVAEGGYVGLPTARNKMETVPSTSGELSSAVLPDAAPERIPNPADVPPAQKPLQVGDEGVTYKSREQIMEDNKVQRPFFAKVNEALFDSNAPLRDFSKQVKSRTGRTLKVEEDPHALAQLRNGMDEAGAARMQSMVNDMEYIRKNKLTDAWKQYGISQQVSLDRNGIYSPEVVAAEAAKLENLKRTLSPEQLAQVEAAVQRTIEFQDGQLQRLRDAGFISQEGYDAIKEINPNYFTRFNFADYIDDNRRLFASTNSNNISKNIIQAVKGAGENTKYVIEDPAEAITRAALKTENLLQQNKIFESIGNLQTELPDMVKKLRDADDVQGRIDLSLENKELRPLRDEYYAALKKDKATVRRLVTQINNLEKEGYKLSLKNGGERMTPGDITVSGLGGDVPTSKTTTNQLGPQDTATMMRNLIEKGSRSDIDRLKKMVGRRDQKVADLLDEIGYTKSQYDEIVGKMKANRDEASSMADLDVPEGYEAIEGYRNGFRERIAVPQYIADAYKGKNDAQIGAMERIMMAASKPFKAAATILSPAFLVKNSIRDTGTHWMTSQNISKAERLLIVPYATRWVRGFMDSITNSEFSQQITKAGGGASGVFNDRGDTTKLVRDITKKVTGEEVKTPAGLFKTAARMVGKYTGISKVAGGYAKGMQAAGRALEYAPRLAEARAAIEKGASDPAAALAARNALGDLQNGGTVSRLLNNYVPFMNSILQGNRRIVQSVRENPKNAAAMLGAGIALPVVSGYVWNRTMYPDVLDQISSYDRENNFILILGDEKDENNRYTQVIKIPKNDAAKVFGNNLEVALDKFAGKDSQGFAELFLKTIGYAQPIQVEREGKLSLDATVGSTIAANPLVRVPVEQATNHSFFTGGEIVPESMQGLDPKDQVTERTAPIDKLAAQVGIEPQRFANVRQGVSAGLVGDNPAQQIQKSVTGASGTRGTSEFYTLRNVVADDRKKASAAINRAIAANDIAAAQDIAARYNAKFKSTFDPWIEKYGASADEDMQEAFGSLRLQLNKRSIKQRRSNIKAEAK